MAVRTILCVYQAAGKAKGSANHEWTRMDPDVCRKEAQKGQNISGKPAINLPGNRPGP
jgi:hypothetical protein